MLQKKLRETFKGCGEWATEPPAMPMDHESGLTHLFAEANRQMFFAVNAFLADNYGLRRHLEEGDIAPRGGIEKSGRDCYMEIYCDNPRMLPEDFQNCRDKISLFTKDFMRAMTGLDNISVFPAKTLTFVRIRYAAESLQAALKTMLDDFYPNNDEARDHMRNLAHLMERFSMNAPARSLH